MKRLQQRLSSEQGFTLIELLVVMIIIGILIAIAVPSYLSFRGKAQDTAGASDVRAAVPDAEEYFANNNTYSGMDGASLLALDSGLSKTVLVTNVTGTGYCLRAPGQTNITWYYSGPGGGAAGGVTSSQSQATNCTGP